MFRSPPKSDLPVVLLIDDDLVSREVTATVLTMTGYTVHTADRRRRSAEDARRRSVPARRHPDGRADARPERHCDLIAELRDQHQRSHLSPSAAATAA